METPQPGPQEATSTDPSLHQGVDPSLLGEISLEREIAMLRHDPSIGSEELFSSNKMQSAEYPDRPGVRIALETPIETAVSGRSDVKQDLMAVLALGKNIAIGVVRGQNQSGEEVNYLSLLSDDPSGSEGRAKLVDVLSEGTPVTIGRGKIEEIAGREGASPGVSGTHCTIELKDGILTVVDETSTNGTSVFSNSTTERQRQFGSIEQWSQPSQETGELIKAAKETERQAKATQLGRFSVGHS